MDPSTVTSPDTAPPAPTVPVALEPWLAGLEQRLDRLVQSRFDAAEAQKQANERLSLLQHFAAEHPDFPERQADGTLDALRAGNPLLDEVGAYLTYRLGLERDQATKNLDEARREAADKAEADLLQRVKTKRLAATLGATPAGPNRGQGLDPELGEPEKFGGINHVLAARLAARRKAQGL